MNKTKNITSKKTVAKNGKTTVASIPASTTSAKKGRGRPKGSLGFGLVSLKSLVEALPETATLPISTSILRSLSKVGVNIPSTPFCAVNGAIGEITKQYSKTSNISVVDLNISEVVA